jgi:hypothetical protein
VGFAQLSVATLKNEPVPLGSGSKSTHRAPIPPIADCRSFFNTPSPALSPLIIAPCGCVCKCSQECTVRPREWHEQRRGIVTEQGIVPFNLANDLRVYVYRSALYFLRMFAWTLLAFGHGPVLPYVYRLRRVLLNRILPLGRSASNLVV